MRQHSYFLGQALLKLGSSNCCIFEMKRASGLKTFTKSYFLFYLKPSVNKKSQNLAFFTLQSGDVTVKTIYLAQLRSTSLLSARGQTVTQTTSQDPQQLTE